MVAIFADSNRARMRYIKESDTGWGVTPASGASRELRYTSSSMNATKATTTSDEIRADRMISDIVETSVSSAGDINIEFSAGSHDDFLEGFAYGAWTRPMTFDQFNGTILAVATSSTITITGADYSGYFTATRRIRLQGFVNAANNDYFQISSATYSAGVTTITTAASTMVTEAGSVYSSLFDANDVIVLKNATVAAAANSFTGTGVFTAAIAAGQLNVGQKIYVDGLGYERGTVTFSTILPTAPTIVSVADGTNTWFFQFAGSLPATGNYVAVAGSATAATQATNFVTAVNTLHAAGSLNVAATASAGVVTLKNLNKTGGAIVKVSDTASDITVVNFSGGVAAASGFFTITSLANDTLGVTPSPTVVASGAIPVTIKGSMLRNPNTSSTITPHSFSLETGFEDVAQYFMFNGQRVGSFSYDVASNSILKGSFAFQGKATALTQTTTLGGGSYTVLGTTATDVGNASVNVGSVLINGAALSTAIQSISVKGTNNLRNQMAVANTFAAGIGAGRMEISGTVVAYFADQTLWTKFINHNTVSLNYNYTDADSNHYEFTFPTVVFSTDTVHPGGKDQDIIETMEFMAKRDPATNCMFQVDRFSCTAPTATSV